MPSLLADVAQFGWDSPAGRRAVELMRQACRREASRWTRTAGWLTDEGLAMVWEQMNRLVLAGRFDDAPGLLRVVVRRAYAGEAAAAQTGFGSPTTRGLIGAIQRSEAGTVRELADDPVDVGRDDVAGPVAPPWMRTWPRCWRWRGGGGRSQRCTR